MTRTLFSITAALALLPTGLWAAISVGPASAVLTFDTAPAASEWSTLNIAGEEPVDAAAVAALVQATAASSITAALPTSGTTPPSALNQARYNTTLQLLQTKPTGNAATLLMATLQNDSGGALTSISVSYDLGNASDTATCDTPMSAHQVFYSLTGAASSWVPVPELTGGPAGAKAAQVSVGSWAAGTTMFLLFADPNCDGSTDLAWTIDNFFVGQPNVPITFVVEPVSTNVTEGATVELSCQVAGSPPYIYEWLLNSGTIAGETSSTLLLTGLQEGTYNYQVRVTGGAGNQILSSNAVVTVSADAVDPWLISAVRQRDYTNIIVTFSEPMSEDALQTFLYSVCYDEGISDCPPLVGTSEDGLSFIFVPGSDDTQVLLATPMPGDLNAPQWIALGGMTDKNGNYFASQTGYVITNVYIPQFKDYQQGVNGYTGTVDTWVEEDSPDLSFGASTPLEIDNAGPHADGLVRFDGIFGPDQIPLGSLIKSATLRLYTTDPGNNVNVHQVLIPWDGSSTWNSLTASVSPDDIEAVATPVATFDPNPDEAYEDIDVTATVQAWANGQLNYGWVLINTGTGSGGGYNPSSSEDTTVARRPLLSVEYGGCGEPAAPVIVSVPPSGTITVGQSKPFEIVFGATGCPAPDYQWYFRPQGAGTFTMIAGATSASYGKAAASLSDEGAYYVQISNTEGSTNSPTITVDVVPDTFAPGLASVVATGTTNLTTVIVEFNEPVDPTTAVVVGNYSLSPVTVISSPVLVSDDTVQLTVSAPFGQRYYLTARNVQDLAGNAIPAAGITMELTSALLVADYNATWSYDTSNTDFYSVVPPFYAPTFDASLWLTGTGAFGDEVNPPGAFTLGTTIDVSTYTIYYRNTSIVWPYAPASLDPAVQIGVRHAIDDGVVFYFNGTEAFRFKMPAGDVTHLTFSDNDTPPYTADEAVLATNYLASTVLQPGNNTIAASLHPVNATSSDDVFACQIWAILEAQAPLTIVSVPPTNHIVLTQGMAFSMTFGVEGPDPSFQWYFSNSVAGFTQIAGATTDTYSVDRALKASHEGFYYMNASNPYPSSTNSPIIQVTVLPDPVIPQLVSAVRQGDEVSIVATFSKAVWPAEATNAANYTITRSGSSAIAVSAVALAADGLSAVLTAASPVGTNYTLTVNNVTDTAANPLNPNTAIIKTPAWFQEGVGGYAGTQDTYVRADNATTAYGSALLMLVDGDSPISHGLIRFDNIISDTAVPYGATINSATLRLYTANVGDDIALFQMLAPWDESSTWDSLGGGVSNSVSGVAEAYFSPNTANVYVEIDVTASVQAWATGVVNYGWALTNMETDGFQCDSSETTNAATRMPALIVDFTPSGVCYPLAIVDNPDPVTVDEGDTLSLSVVVSGSSPAYQWQRSSTPTGTFTAIAGANSATYSVASALPANSGYYRCVVVNDCPSSVTSAVAQVTVNADNVPPHVLSAIAKANQGAPMDTVVVTLDEAVQPAGATTPANYTLSSTGGTAPSVTAATLDAEGTTITLTLDSGLTFGIQYNLAFSAAITDYAAALNRISPSSTNIVEQSVFLTWSSAWSYDELQVATNEATGAIADGYWTNTTPFYATGFTPSGWLSGPGILATEDDAGVINIAPAPFATSFTQTSNTIYLRTTANYVGPTDNVGLQVNHFIDDGVLCFLNGAELFRFKMSDTNLSAILHTTQSASGGEAVNASTNLAVAPLAGNNLIACSLHTQGTTSSDAVFGLELAAYYPVAAAAKPRLTITRLSTTQVRVSWDPAQGVLQTTAAISATPTWSDAPSQANPQTNTVSGKLFYKLRE